MNSVVEPCALGGLLLADARDLLGQVEALARVEQVADDHADREGGGRHGEEVGQREAATLPTLAALRTRPHAQHEGAEDDGWIIILISATKVVPIHLRSTAKSGTTRPTIAPRTTATMTAM